MPKNLPNHCHGRSWCDRLQGCVEVPNNRTVPLRATSHMWLRACDHYYISSTLVGGKGGAGGPSSHHHTTLEGPTEGVCECTMDVKLTWISTWWHRIYHVSWSLGLFPITASWRSALAQDRETMATVDLLCFIMCKDPHEWRFIDIASGWGPNAPYDFTLCSRFRDHTTWFM